MEQGAISQYLNDSERLELAAELEGLFSAAGKENRNEDVFGRLALRVYRWQYARSEPFRRLCESTGRGSELTDIAEAPFVPAEAFKNFRLACFPPSPDEIVFHTSGTTSGRHGSHYLPTTSLYDAAAIPWLRRHLLPPRLERPRRFISLTQSPASAPRSSLVHMIDSAGKSLAKGSAIDYLYAPDNPDWTGRFIRAMEDASAAGDPVLIFTTAFALLQAMEKMDGEGKTIAAPEGTRIMETGGYKGRTREIAHPTLYTWAAERLGIPMRAIVNQYGMTEMSSQFYDRTLSDPAMSEREARIKMPPPWVRSSVVDPATRRPVADGEIGALQHIDLANLDSCAFIATGDQARRVGDGFEILGRLAEAELRGCSLDFEKANPARS